MARTIYVVCTRDGGWPPEAWAAFGTEDAAREHVDAAYWAFRIEPFPVYASYRECPPENREQSGDVSAIAKQSMRRRGWPTGNEPAGSARLQRVAPPEPPWGAATGVVYAVTAGERPQGPDSIVEVELFYATEIAARKHVARPRRDVRDVLPFIVYGSYEECPADRRYDSQRRPRPLSQLSKIKGRRVRAAHTRD